MATQTDVEIVGTPDRQALAAIVAQICQWMDAQEQEYILTTPQVGVRVFDQGGSLITDLCRFETIQAQA